MRRRLIAVTVAGVVIVAVVALTAVGRGGAGAGDRPEAAFATRTQEAGEVTVEATLRRVDATGATAALVFDTHAVDLDLDVAGGTVLTVGGRTWPTDAWEGDGPGGHHRAGELRFTAGGPPEGEAVLTVDGLSEPVTFRWQLTR